MRGAQHSFRDSVTKFKDLMAKDADDYNQPKDTLQDKMVLDDSDLKKRRESSRADMITKLPPLPHEIEIKAELEDEEELLHLYKEVESKKKEAVEKRKEIAMKSI